MRLFLDDQRVGNVVVDRPRGELAAFIKAAMGEGATRSEEAIACRPDGRGIVMRFTPVSLPRLEGALFIANCESFTVLIAENGRDLVRGMRGAVPEGRRAHLSLKHHRDNQAYWEKQPGRHCHVLICFDRVSFGKNKCLAEGILDQFDRLILLPSVMKLLREAVDRLWWGE